MQKSMMNSKLRSVITLIDRLRDINLQSYVKLPKIVAVGSQSSGKSSLVQQVVGLDFLPRGSGVVTRRPLEIRMSYNHDVKQPYAQFEELPNQKFTDFSEVKKNIGVLTDKVCGTKKNIIDKAIILNIHSSHCPNLTIIDLPGMTRIALEGQDQNIHQVTTKMIRKYMEDPNTIILCVIPANQDITNDEVLNMARKIDKNGDRTIGCVTKIDIMDRGTDARELLLNKSVIQMKLGFFGIRNRSQADIQENKTVQQSIEDEKMFFSKSPIYSSLPPECIGTGSLVTRLTKVLSKSITKFLPELVAKIKERKHELSSIIKEYGRPLPKTPQEKQALTWQLCSEFIREYKKSLSGEVTVLKAKQDIQKVSYKIREDLHMILDQQFTNNSAEELTDSHILFAMKKFQGSNMPGFPSIHSFMFLLDPLLHKLKLPLATCLQGVCDSMIHMAELVIADIAHQYIQFREYLVSKAIDVINVFRRHSSEFIANIMEAEINYIYTSNPLFDELVNRESTEKEKKSELARQNPLIVVLRKRVAAYYKVIVQNLRDLIPKNISYMLLKNAIERLEFQVFQDSGFGSSKADDWFVLGDSAMRERLAREKQFETIQKAEQFLLTHSGLADIRKGQLDKKRVLREKEISQATKKRKEHKKKETSPVREEYPSKNVQNSVEKNTFPQSQAVRQPASTTITNEKTEKPAKTDNFAALFGMGGGTTKKQQAPKTESNKPQQQIPKGKMGFTETYNKEAGKATDNAVDDMYKNEKFQEQSKKAVRNGTSMAAQQQLGVSQQTGNMFGKGAAWVFGQQATQNYLKDETKKQVRGQTQINPNQGKKQ